MHPSQYASLRLQIADLASGVQVEALEVFEPHVAAEEAPVEEEAPANGKGATLPVMVHGGIGHVSLPLQAANTFDLCTTNICCWCMPQLCVREVDLMP